MAETKEYLEPWWAAACADKGAHAEAHAAVQEARMVLIGAKAAKLVHFKIQKMGSDKALKRKEVKKVKDLITGSNVEGIFPAALSTLLNAV